MKPLTPNIILIILDATRADHLGCYGYTRDTSPNIDHFASEATLFENAWAPAVWTLPAMTSIFTGLYPIEHGINHAKATLPNNAITLVQKLKDFNYQTAAIVATPWTTTGTKLQFDVHILVDRLFNTVEPRWWHLGLQKLYWQFMGRKDKGANKINELAFRWLVEQRRPEHPFFLYLHYLEPHAPLWPPKSYRNRYLTNKFSTRKLRRLSNIELPFLTGQVTLTNDEIAAINELYDAQICYLDEMIGRFLNKLAKLISVDDTMIIIAADHGENLGQNRFLGHQYCLYDTLLRVPLIIRYPAHFPIGTRISSMVQTLDIMATIAEFVDHNKPWQPTANRWFNLKQALQTENCLSNRTYAQYLYPMVERFQRWYPQYDYTHFERKFWGIRTNKHKLIRDDQGNSELYDYQKDPNETNNLAKWCPDLTKSLSDELTNWIDKLHKPNHNPQLGHIDPIVAERLKNLGYL